MVRNQSALNIVLITVTALLVAVIYTGLTVRRATQNLEREIQTLGERLRAVDPLIAKWNDKDGIEHTVKTDWRVGETAAEQASRHAARVEALKAIYPPVNP